MSPDTSAWVRLVVAIVVSLGALYVHEQHEATMIREAMDNRIMGGIAVSVNDIVRAIYHTNSTPSAFDREGR
jgi:hypothetical protein